MFLFFITKKSATSNEIADMNYFLIFVINIFYIKIAKESRQFCYSFIFSVNFGLYFSFNNLLVVTDIVFVLPLIVFSPGL